MNLHPGVQVIAYDRLPFGHQLEQRGAERSRFDLYVPDEVVFEADDSNPKSKRVGLDRVLELSEQASLAGAAFVVVVLGLEMLGRTFPHLVSVLRKLLDRGQGILVVEDDGYFVCSEKSAQLMEVFGPSIGAASLVARLDEARATIASEKVRYGQQRASSLEDSVPAGRPNLLSVEQERKVWELLQVEPVVVVAERFGVSRQTITRIRDRRVRTLDEQRGSSSVVKGHVDESTQKPESHERRRDTN